MTQYLYPQNLTAKSKIWLWEMKEFFFLCFFVLISIVLFVTLKWIIPSAFTLCYAFLTIKKDDTTILDFIKYALRYFVYRQQYYEWR